jgi:hypothetical protein
LGLAALGGTLVLGAAGGVCFFRGGGLDYRGRWVEARYVRRGLNPNEAPRPGAAAVDPERAPLAADYPPWSYAYLEYTLGLLPWRASRVALLTLDLAVVGGIWSWAYRRGRRLRGGRVDGLVLLGVSLLSLGLQHIFYNGNYGLICAGALVGMVGTERRGWHYGSALFWALMMVKPQLGVLPGFYFLVQRQWKTIALAVLLVVGAGAWVGWQTGTSPVTMLTQMSANGLTVPLMYEMGASGPLVYYHWLTLSRALSVSSILGAAATFALLLIYRGLAPEYLLCIPAVFATFWTYSTPGNWLVLALLVVLCAELALRRGSPMDWAAFLLVLAAYALPNLARYYMQTVWVFIVPLVRYAVWVVGLIWLLRSAADQPGHPSGPREPATNPAGIAASP